MFAGSCFIIFIGLFCVLEAVPSGLLYQRMIRNGRHGKEVIEIFYNGIEPPKCDKSVCKPMDDEELTEYLKKSVLAGIKGPQSVPFISKYNLSIITTAHRLNTEKESTNRATNKEYQTTTESLFISQEEGEEEEEGNEDEDDNTY